MPRHARAFVVSRPGFPTAGPLRKGSVVSTFVYASLAARLLVQADEEFSRGTGGADTAYYSDVVWIRVFPSWKGCSWIAVIARYRRHRRHRMIAERTSSFELLSLFVPRAA